MKLEEKVAKEKRGDVLLWPIKWRKTILELIQFAKEGRLVATDMTNQAITAKNISDISPWVTFVTILLLIKFNWFLVAAPFIIWIFGKMIYSWVYSRTTGLGTAIASIVLAVLYGLFWGILFSWIPFGIYALLR